MQCPECKEKHITKAGFKMTRHGKVQKYQCWGCGRISDAKGFKTGKKEK